MTSDPDIPYMHRFPFGDDVVDRLLSGSLPTASTPEAYRSVVALFEAVTGPATSGELARAEAYAAVASAAVLETVPSPPGSRSVLKKIMTAKAAAVATTLAFGLGTAAAAATGSLPGQGSSHANSHADHGQATAAANHSDSSNTSPSSSSSTTSTSVAGTQTNTSNSSIPKTGPANQNAQFGLCTAFLNGQKHITTSSSTTSLPPQYSSTAFKALIAENGSVAATTTYCQHLVTAHQTSTGSGSPEQGKPATPGNSTSHDTTGGKPANTGKPTGSPGKGSSH